MRVPPHFTGPGSLPHARFRCSAVPTTPFPDSNFDAFPHAKDWALEPCRGSHGTTHWHGLAGGPKYCHGWLEAGHRTMRLVKLVRLVRLPLSRQRNVVVLLCHSFPQVRCDVTGNKIRPDHKLGGVWGREMLLERRAFRWHRSFGARAARAKIHFRPSFFRRAALLPRPAHVIPRTSLL